MFESIEIRKAANGFIMVVTRENEEAKEYVYDTPRKLTRIIKQYVDPKAKAEPADE
jgi:hypothetical protein